jgi:hypothetical protein
MLRVCQERMALRLVVFEVTHRQAAASVSPTLPSPPPVPLWRSLFSLRSRRRSGSAGLAAASPTAPPPLPSAPSGPGGPGGHAKAVRSGSLPCRASWSYGATILGLGDAAAEPFLRATLYKAAMRAHVFAPSLPPPKSNVAHTPPCRRTARAGCRTRWRPRARLRTPQARRWPTHGRKPGRPATSSCHCRCCHPSESCAPKPARPAARARSVAFGCVGQRCGWCARMPRFSGSGLPGGIQGA